MKNFVLELNGKVVADAQRFKTIEKKFNNLCNLHKKEGNVIIAIDARTSDIVLSNDPEQDDLYY